MSSYAEYSERVSERYGILSGLGTPTVSWEDAYVPLRARRGTNQARQDLARHKDAVIQARKRVRLERVKELLEIQPQVELMSNAPFGLTAAVEDLVRQDRRLVLLGGAGAGKTTALRYLAAKQPVSRLEISEEGETVEARLVPVMVFLPEVGDRSLSEYLSDQATSLYEPPHFSTISCLMAGPLCAWTAWTRSQIRRKRRRQSGRSSPGSRTIPCATM